tara:strand:+ start:334 stop:693 length:360 start_codon:yes stop_codon:yes gene_type:complete
MLNKNYEWNTEYESHHIKVTCWYDLSGEHLKGGGEVLVDNEIVGSWGLVIPEGKKPIVSITRVNDRIRFLNIYAAGAFKPKISIEVNGKFIHQDKLNMFDRYGVNNPKLIKKIKKWAGL